MPFGPELTARGHSDLGRLIGAGLQVDVAGGLACEPSSRLISCATVGIVRSIFGPISGTPMDDKFERFVYGVGVLAILVAIMWFLMLLDDGRPSVRKVCHAHPSSDSVLLGEDDDGQQHFASCHRDGLGALIVEVPSMIVDATSRLVELANGEPKH